MPPVDPTLVERAREAGALLGDAERQAQLARANYHAVIRRLHLAGASLREIGGALDLSHQRVQQIVDGAGGTWWRRVWRSRNARRDACCTFCELPPAEVKQLIAGPNIFICGACTAKATKVLDHGAGEPGLRLAGRASKVKCGFCGRGRTTERAVVHASDAGICVDCLGLCRTILTDRGC